MSRRTPRTHLPEGNNVHRARTIMSVLTGVLVLAACSSAATPPPSQGGTGVSPTPTPSSLGLSQGSPSSAPSPSSSASSQPGSPALTSACDLLTQQAVSAAVGVQLEAGKAGKITVLPQMTEHSNCYYTNGSAPASSVPVEVVTYLPVVPVATVEAHVLANLLSKAGTHNGATADQGDDRRKSRLHQPATGKGVGGVPYHIDTAGYWNGQTVVSVTAGNDKVGAAPTLATVVAGELP